MNRFRLILSLLFLVASLPVFSETQETFEVAGIKYGILYDGKTVEVLPSEPVYSGHITIPENVIYNNTAYKVIRLGDKAFFKCEELLSLKLPESIEDLGDYVFNYCVSLDEIKLPDSVLSLGISDFAYCYKIRKIVLPKKIRMITGCSFISCTSLEEVVIPWGCEAVLASAFSTCTSLKSLNYPATVKEINPSSAHDCYSLSRLVFGTGMNDEWEPAYGSLTFYGIAAPYKKCNNIKEVISLYLTPPTVGIGTPAPNAEPISNPVFDDVVFEQATLYVPDEAIENYRGAEMWANFRTIRPVSEFSGIKETEADHNSNKKTYIDLNGHKSDSPFNGINIVIDSNGVGKKIYIK